MRADPAVAVWYADGVAMRLLITIALSLFSLSNCLCFVRACVCAFPWDVGVGVDGGTLERLF